MKPLLIKASDAAELLGMHLHDIYALAADEDGPFEKRYIGKGTRNFRLTYESVERYAANLPSQPVGEAS